MELPAWATAADGDQRQAARLLGTAGVLRRDAGTTIAAFGPHLAADHTRCAEAVARALGPDGYREALAVGARHDTPARASACASGACALTACRCPGRLQAVIVHRHRHRRCAGCPRTGPGPGPAHQPPDPPGAGAGRAGGPG
ncbi:hypothetical protein ABT173_43010 [Streptomyces sp. NPDC001795]|uniref:hypothetical protein n=1 Tax=Streptomyces sp. NPDC001795 TaxID=3154525 RepID=UPI003330048D